MGQSVRQNEFLPLFRIVLQEETKNAVGLSFHFFLIIGLEQNEQQIVKGGKVLIGVTELTVIKGINHVLPFLPHVITKKNFILNLQRTHFLFWREQKFSPFKRCDRLVEV